MAEKNKIFLYGLVWTTIEAFVGATAACGAFSKIDWDVTLFVVLIADLIYVGKSIAIGVPGVTGAKEITDEEALEIPKEEYTDIDNYDDRYIDDTVDEDDEDEVE